MDFDIKEEPTDYETADLVSEELMVGCCLCPEGLKLQNAIAEHFQRVHKGKNKFLGNSSEIRLDS